ncbi:hypothetical protein Tco_0441419 [Tanacetum coccineum]
MSSGSQTVGDAVVPKFDMHVYTSVLTSDEVKSLVAEYAIPSDLHPCVPPSGLTMNRLPIDKIGIYDQYLELSGVRVPFSTFLLGKVVEYENERVLAAKRKAQAAKDRAVRKRAATEGDSQQPKKKKTTPLSFALSDSEAYGSNCSGFGTHHSASPLNTIISNEAELTTGCDGLILESINRVEEDTDHHLDNMEDTTEVNSPLSEHSPRSQHSNPSDEDTHNVRNEPTHTQAFGSTSHGVSSSYGGSHRQAFPRRNPGGEGIGSSLRDDVGLPMPFVLAWNLTTHSILNDAESCWDTMIDLATPRYEALNEDYGELYESHRSCQDVSDRLTETQNQLVDTVQSRNKLSDDHKALQQVHLGCVRKEANLTEKLAAVEKEKDDILEKNREREERIKQLEADLASKTSSLTEAERAISTLKGDLERLTRLLSSDEYKKSLSDVFDLAIAAGWSEGVKATCSEEEAEAFLATAIDYDPACKTTFMSEFDYIFNKSYSYVEKLVESFRLSLRDLHNMWPEGTGPTLSGNAADVQ